MGWGTHPNLLPSPASHCSPPTPHPPARLHSPLPGTHPPNASAQRAHCLDQCYSKNGPWTHIVILDEITGASAQKPSQQFSSVRTCLLCFAKALVCNKLGKNKTWPSAQSVWEALAPHPSKLPPPPADILLILRVPANMPSPPSALPFPPARSGLI